MTGPLGEERSRQDACAPRVKTAEPDREAMMAAIREVFASGEAREQDVAIREVARQLGFQRTGSRIQHAIRLALRAAAVRGIVRRDEAMRAGARHLGFLRTGSKIREAFKSAINGAIRRGLLEYDGAMIRKVR